MDTRFRRLFEAAHAGDVDSLKTLLQEDNLLLDRVVTTAEVNDNPLHVAALRGHTAFAKEILQWTPQLAREFNGQGMSPLHLAAAQGHFMVVKELLEVGADLCNLRKNRNDYLPVHIAVNKGRHDLVTLLIEKCESSLNEVTYRSETLLHLAVKANCLETIEYFTARSDAQLTLDAKDSNGNTCLHLAVAGRQHQVIEHLLSQEGIDVNAVNEAGHTPLDVLLVTNQGMGDLYLAESIITHGGKIARELGASETNITDFISINVHRASHAMVRFTPTDRQQLRRMPGRLLKAATDGNTDDLVQLLGLEQPENISDSSAATINPLNIQSVTHVGDNVLHILVTNGHNELACMVFKKDTSLLKAPNKTGDTPLHSAAKVGNYQVIIEILGLVDYHGPSKLKDAARVTNCHGEAALHEAAKHGHTGVVDVLMTQVDLELAYEVNNEGFSPLYIAVVGGYTYTVETMLEKDARFANIPDSNGLLPIHVATCMGNKELVKHFLEKDARSSELKDPRRWNIFHFAAEENKAEVLAKVFELEQANKLDSEIVVGMIKAKDFEGNTPLHIAAMKGHNSVMKAVWERMNDVATIKNNQDRTPFDLSVIQVKATNKDMGDKIEEHVNKKGGFTREWFDIIVNPPLMPNYSERIQIIGLGSVFITTATFAVAFALPGGLNQKNGTPILGKKYLFRAFIVADVMAFLYAFLGLYFLILTALYGLYEGLLRDATLCFFSAATYMVVAFGLGLFVVLTPSNNGLGFFVLFMTLAVLLPTTLYAFYKGRRKHTRSFTVWAVLLGYILPIVVIFSDAFSYS